MTELVIGHDSPFHQFSQEYDQDYDLAIYDDQDSIYNPNDSFLIKQEITTKMNPDCDTEKVYTILDSTTLPNFASFLKNPPDSGSHSPLNLADFSLISRHSDEKPGWDRIHVKNWTSQDVVRWVYSVADDYSISGEVRGEAFNEFNGSQLCLMKEDDFKVLSKVHYQIFYRQFNQLRTRGNFHGPESPPEPLHAVSPLLSQTSEHFQMHIPREAPMLEDVTEFPGLMDCSPEAAVGTVGDIVAVLGHHEYELNRNDNFHDISNPGNSSINHNASHAHLGSTSSSPSSHHHHLHHLQRPQSQPLALVGANHHRHHHRYPRTEAEPDDLGYISGDSENSHARMVPNLDSFRRESPASHLQETAMHIDDQDEEPLAPEKPKKVPGKRGRKPGQTTRGNHLWEFMRDLLKDNRYNPSVVEWKDPKLGVFRVVQSGEVARMWGEKKKNNSMNYEKLSRAMRFCRDKGYFANVPKSGNYPKKLCFAFGERAFGWQPTDLVP